MLRNQLIIAPMLLVVLIPISPVSADEWPQWRGPNRDGVWNETGILEAFDGPEVPIRWRVPIGSGYSGPSRRRWTCLRYRPACETEAG